MPPARHLRPYLLPLEVQIRGNGGFRSQEAQGSGRGEPTAQAAAVGERIGPSRVEDGPIKKVLTRPRQREAVAAIQEAGVSQRKSCALVGIWRGTCRYHAKGDEEEVLLRQRLRDLAVARPRFGSPRLGALLRQELGAINHKRVERLYAQEGLQLPKRGKKPRRSWSRVMPVEVPTHPLQRWSLDFIHDSLRAGRRFRALTNGRRSRVPRHSSGYLHFGTAGDPGAGETGSTHWSAPGVGAGQRARVHQ